MQISSYNEAREYLESFIRPSIYARVDVEPNIPHPLKRMEAFLALLGDPQKQFKSIQISGTSGKGSTSYLLSHILTLCGYKTGLTISPHLQKLTERIQINNLEIPDNEFIALLNEIIPHIDAMKHLPLGEPSYFEILLALAFLHFARENIDIAIIEVGLEGRLDGTNVLEPLLGVITNIDLDHTEILGTTIEEITNEAISIIKHNPASKMPMKIISGAKQDAVLHIISTKCKEVNASLRILKDDMYTIQSMTTDGSVFSFNGKTRYESLSLRLVGEYQVENAALALLVLQELEDFGFSIPEQILRTAFETAAFPGRFELTTYVRKAKRYNVLLDGAHNPAKMHAFARTVQTLFPNRRKLTIVSFKKGKDTETMLSVIGNISHVLILTSFQRTMDTSKNASLPTAEFLSHTKSFKGELLEVASVADAITCALEKAKDDDLIIITGSLYLVGEARELLMDGLSTTR